MEEGIEYETNAWVYTTASLKASSLARVRRPASLVGYVALMYMYAHTLVLRHAWKGVGRTTNQTVSLVPKYF